MESWKELIFEGIGDMISPSLAEGVQAALKDPNIGDEEFVTFFLIEAQRTRHATLAESRYVVKEARDSGRNHILELLWEQGEESKSLRDALYAHSTSEVFSRFVDRIPEGDRQELWFALKARLWFSELPIELDVFKMRRSLETLVSAPTLMDALILRGGGMTPELTKELLKSSKRKVRLLAIHHIGEQEGGASHHEEERKRSQKRL